MTLPRLGHPNLGLGLGLRTVHYQHILEHSPDVDWFEIISENYMDSAGRPRYVLEQIAERYPIVMHGVSLSIGSTDPLNLDYLRKLRELADATNARWVSDHVCWTGVAGRNAHDLLPIPYTKQALRHVIERVRIVEDLLERPLVLENPSTYVTFAQSTMSEWEFLTRLTDETGCGLLVDVNNVYVSCFNHDLDPAEFLRSIPHERVVQFHLAGHTNCGTHLIDTHDGHVVNPVWELYRLAHELTGGAATLLEWDAKIPPFPVVHAEVLKARDHMAELPGFAADEADPDGEPAAIGIPQPATYATAEFEMTGDPLELARIQRWMQAVITHPDGIQAGLGSPQARSEIDLRPDDVERVVTSSTKRTSVERLEIYGNAYYARLLECLRDEFPALFHAVGEEVFDGLAFGYLQSCPSTSYTLSQLGAKFADYLAETRPVEEGDDAGPSWPEFMIDLARLERTYSEIFDGPGMERTKRLESVDLERIGPEEWQSARLIAAPCLRVLELRFPVHEYATGVRKKEDPPIPESQPTWLAVSRIDYVVRRWPLTRAQFETLRAILDGEPLWRSIERGGSAALADGLSEPVEHELHDWFQEWAAAGFFQRIETP